jgi:hypothetical protein
MGHLVLAVALPLSRSWLQDILLSPDLKDIRKIRRCP